jgi:hypothetical protein
MTEIDPKLVPKSEYPQTGLPFKPLDTRIISKIDSDLTQFFKGNKPNIAILDELAISFDTVKIKPILESNNTPPVNTALRFNKGKLDWSLVPFDALEEMVKVLQFGAEKYAPGNWANGEGLSYRETISCMLRHAFALLRMEDMDPESKLHHIGHVQCNALFLAYMIKYPQKFTRDDRLDLLNGRVPSIHNAD